MQQQQCSQCQGQLIKYGFLKKERTQRYRCKQCKKVSSDAQNRTFGTLRSQPQTITLVVQLLTEGMGVRAAARVANVHRDTVLRILKHAGKRAHSLLKNKLINVPVKHIEADEIHTYVLKKDKLRIDPELDRNPWGDFYIFLGLESNTKLLLMPTIGKRTEAYTAAFARDMAESTTGRFQLTTDGFRPYKSKMREAFGSRIDFAQFYKEHNMQVALRMGRQPRNMKTTPYLVRSGSPTINRITTAHVERANLSLRHFNRRFTRKGISFSKAQEYLNYSVYLFVAAHNFCKIHKGILGKQTPAMASGLADKPWNISELLIART